uniref:Periplasmic heavy metal sensor n=1 Tax=Solibacter usitatus (strain Ellin6076) TaxID=234267 RepID=Q01XX6_SOLUE
MLRKILLTGLLASTLVFAQRGGGGGGSRGGGSNMPNIGFGGGTPFDKVSDALKLSKDQKKDFKAAMDEGQKQATPVHEEILKTRQQIAEAVAGGKSSEELVKNEGVLEAQMAEIEMRAFAKVAETLEEDQKPRAGMLFQMMRGFFAKKNWNTTEN